MKNYPLLKKLLPAYLSVAFVLISHTVQSQINLWTWVGGDSASNGLPVFGTRGVPSSATNPGGAWGMMNFTDTSGNFYLFEGYVNRGNPLWRYTPSTNQWTWMHGDSANTNTTSTGVYGVKGVSAPANIPPRLIGATVWSDAYNNCWLFGGDKFGGGYFSDLWKYSVATNQWTWVNGTSNLDQYGVYGTKGVASPANRPGARNGAKSWTDAAGNLWLFGGQGLTTRGPSYLLNDVWKYDVAIGQWAWMTGDSLGNQQTVYGTLGVASPATNPGNVFNCYYWKDATGNFWLFKGIPPQQGTPINALWMFSTTTAQWTWMGGDTITNPNGNYGIKGVASPSNVPAIRSPDYFWTDNQDNLWVFGGSMYSNVDQNDLWKYNTTTHEWVWLDGDNSIIFNPPYYGAKGNPYFLNYPGTRRLGTSVKDKAGNLWLYGGVHNDQVNIGTYTYKADLWKLNPSDYNTLGFNMFIDTNYNGIHEASEPYLRNANASISYGTTSFSASSSTGKFTILVDTGTYTTSPVLSVPYYNAIPASHATSFGNTYFNFDTFPFALQPIPGYKDVAIFVTPLLPARPGRGMLYKIECYNPGTSTVSGTFNFIQDNKLLYDSASDTPASISGDTLTWSYNNLKPLNTKNVIVYFKVKTPPAANINDTLHCFANAATLPGESNITDNIVSVTQRIIAGYDPNDKTENHGGKITLAKAVAGEYLQYTIRFQNTGNDTAFDIFVRDTLSSKLNWSTLEMISASHNYQMTINNGKCELTFRNIHLVDSIHNEPQSHGYLTYRIKAKQTIQIGDLIKNKAAIYFDYNLPIFTNTETTTVVADAFPLKLLSFTAKKQEKTNLLNWKTSQEINVDRFEIERSSNGREYAKIGTVKAGQTQYSFTDENPETKNSNYYRLKMIDKDGQFTNSLVRLISNNSFTVAIYPNPAKDKLQVQINSDKPMAMKMQIVSLEGKILISNSFTANEANTLRSINISSLQRGSYLLKVSSESKDEQVIKFEKL